MSDAGTQRTATVNRPGRHRRSTTAGTWTPAVDPAGHHGRHRAPDAPTVEHPIVASISGELPLPAPRAADTAPVPRAADPTPATAPVQRAAMDATEPRPQRAVVNLTESPRAEPARIPPALAGSAQRTKITLDPASEESDEVRVYLAPPLDGLSNFDLGSVPASVTPPRSWRKAAWFATVSSGGVAVALLLAGSYLVGQQPVTTQAVDGWTGFGDRPQMHDEGFAATEPGSSTSSRGTRSSAAPQRITDVAGMYGSSTPGGTSTDDSSAPDTGTPTTTTAGTPTTTPEPQKPPPEPADRETNRDAMYNFPPDAETMGDRSEIFLNEITENPERAHEQTGGDLYAEGADSIARRYADIAYFEVEHIYIDQKNRATVNTVNVMYKDGTSETQQCTLRFEDGDRITQDCA